MVTGIYLLGEWGKRASTPGLRLVLSKGSPTWNVQPNPVALKLSHVAESPGGLWKHRPLGPTPQKFSRSGMGGQEHLSDVPKWCPRRSVENHWPQSISVVIVTTSYEACCVSQAVAGYESLSLQPPWKNEAGLLMPGNVHTVPAGSHTPSECCARICLFISAPDNPAW